MVREFQDCHFGSHVSYKHIMIYAILYLHVALMTPYNPGRCCLKKFNMAVRRAYDLGYLNEICLAILNFHVAPMSPAKIQLNPTYCTGGDVI